jgi:hypothetical protein
VTYAEPPGFPVLAQVTLDGGTEPPVPVMADVSVAKSATVSCAKAVLVEPASIKARIPEGIQFSNLVFCFMFDFGLMVFVFY